ncbi:MAG: PIN domain-containing protein [Verrucomicrobiota bacterium]
MPFIALTLHLDGRLWTGDDKLKAGLRAKGFDRFFES